MSSTVSRQAARGQRGRFMRLLRAAVRKQSGSCRLRGSLFTEGKGFQASIQEYNGERLNSVERIPAPDLVETPVLADTRIKRACGKPDKHVLVMPAGRISSSSAGSLPIKIF